MLRASLAVIFALSAIWAVAHAATSDQQLWQTLNSSDGSTAQPRHESGAVVVNGTLYLLGGRGTRSVQSYDPDARTWTTLGPMPQELHHFQPVAVGSTIYVLGAFTCCYPDETLVSSIYTFDTQSLTWSVAGNIPASRVRGSAAAIVRNNAIYLVGGNTQGHNGGAVSWFDRYDPATGQWQTLADAPNARDHFSAVLVNDYLVAAAGRQTTQPNPFNNAVSQTDVYDFLTGEWTSKSTIPTPRAGALAIAAGDEVLVAGGEINTSTTALDAVEAFNVYSGQWRTLQSLGAGRHSGGGVVLGGQFHVVAGSLNTGGAPETSLHETLLIDEMNNFDVDADGLLNLDERQLYGTDPTLADSDFDQLNDRVEVEDVKSNPTLSDTDGDGIADGEEVNAWHTSPIKPDTDDDGLSDYDEIFEHTTNPRLSDTDSDGLSDFAELDEHATDPANADSDADGLSDAVELFQYATSPLNADTDADGLQDGEEVSLGLNPNNSDSDSDGVIDSEDDDPLNSPNSGNGDSLAGGNGSISYWLFAAIIVGRLSRRRLQCVNVTTKYCNSPVCY